MICNGSPFCNTCENILAQKCVIPKTTCYTCYTCYKVATRGLFRKIRGVCAAFCNRLNLLTRYTPVQRLFDGERTFETLYSVGLLLARVQGRRRSA